MTLLLCFIPTWEPSVKSVQIEHRGEAYVGLFCLSRIWKVAPFGLA
jgi:hypothetical protein